MIFKITVIFTIFIHFLEFRLLILYLSNMTLFPRNDFHKKKHERVLNFWFETFKNEIFLTFCKLVHPYVQSEIQILITLLSVFLKVQIIFF